MLFKKLAVNLCRLVLKDPFQKYRAEELSSKPPKISSESGLILSHPSQSTALGEEKYVWVF
jgi:hypothetical protein